jgi:Ca2+-binding EF-hand superfamily protein
MYDDDEGGTIDFNNLRKVATDLEEDTYIDDEEIEKMIKLADTKGAGSVDFEDFMAIMRKGKLFE